MNSIKVLNYRTNGFAEGKRNLTSHHVEIVGWRCHVTYKPVYVVELLNFEVLVNWLVKGLGKINEVGLSNEMIGVILDNSDNGLLHPLM